MFRRTVAPLSMLAFVFGAFVAGAWALADGNDLAGLYFLTLALVALRVQTRLSATGAA